MPGPPYVPPPGTGGNTGRSGRPGYKHASEFLRNAGFPAYALREGTAVMGAESRYDPEADNGVCCIGLMQINLSWAGKLGVPADRDKAKEWLKVPENNCKVAYKIWLAAGRTFQKDWEARMNGSYRNFLGQDPLIKTGDTTAGDIIGDVGDAIGGVVSPFTDVVNAATHVLTALLNPSTWLRLGKGALGGTLLILGTGTVVYVLANKASGGQVGEAITATVPAKAIGKSVAKATKG